MLHMSWSSERIQQMIENWGLRVIYKAADNITRSVIVNDNQSEVKISKLQPGTTYTIWTVRVTSKGFGLPSKARNITTAHLGETRKPMKTKLKKYVNQFSQARKRKIIESLRGPASSERAS